VYEARGWAGGPGAHNRAGVASTADVFFSTGPSDSDVLLEG
jgi:hypothetical protein